MIEMVHPLIQTQMSEEQIQGLELDFNGERVSLLCENADGGINVAIVSFKEEIAGLRTWVVHHWLDQEQFDTLMSAEGVGGPE